MVSHVPTRALTGSSARLGAHRSLGTKRRQMRSAFSVSIMFSLGFLGRASRVEWWALLYGSCSALLRASWTLPHPVTPSHPRRRPSRTKQKEGCQQRLFATNLGGKMD